MTTTQQPTTSEHSPAQAGNFGANEWLVEEMYERYQADPASVDTAWHDFFADYRPSVIDVGPGHVPAGAPSPASVVAAAQPATAAAARPVPTAQPATAQPATAATATEVPPGAAASAAHAGAAAPTAPADTVAARLVAPAAAPVTERGESRDGPGAAPPSAAATPLRGAAKRVVDNMVASLGIPTATSVRAVPAKLLVDNRVVINNYLRRSRGGKVSFTHLIGYAVVRAVVEHPDLNRHFAEVEGKPMVVTPAHVNFGLAIDLPGKDGVRSLVVPSIKAAETLGFAAFWGAYEDIVRRARTGKLTVDDFADTTVSLTNPGTLGTTHSVARLMPGQGAIIGVGAMEHPAQFSGMSEQALAEQAVSKIITLTSTYDHRIIQGAASGEFLRRVHELLLADEFWDGVFAELRVPYEPVRWRVDRGVTREGQIDKNARIIELINVYRSSGHLLAETDPLEYAVARHPDLDITQYGLTLWDLDREFPVGGFAGARLMKLRDILGHLRDAYCR
ncbi:MAG: 2-oxo acid dehydrogenase subunit E2, partial [Actinomycetia bacterium]|nr:2-oxo acid dehydrogenase subunit E2 [Actinomycetes bacterium]